MRSGFKDRIILQKRVDGGSRLILKPLRPQIGHEEDLRLLHDIIGFPKCGEGEQMNRMVRTRLNMVHEGSGERQNAEAVSWRG